ncbi:hypothetical protein K435DRAFT_636492, partial [Dendrothele bispora CBS 962.96]
NNMYPGNDPDLPELTQMEEMLISPVHALIQVWQVRGGQYKYTGHTCNFTCENAVFHAKVPLLPEQCEIMIMRQKGQGSTVNLAATQDFRVRHEPLQHWLQFLSQHHPTFQGARVEIDWDALQQLPVDGSVYNRLHTIEVED